MASLTFGSKPVITELSDEDRLVAILANGNIRLITKEDLGLAGLGADDVETDFTAGGNLLIKLAGGGEEAEEG